MVVTGKGERSPADIDPVAAFIERGHRNECGDFIDQAQRARTVAVATRNQRIGLAIARIPTGAGQDGRSRIETLGSRSWRSVSEETEIPIIGAGGASAD